MRHGVGLLWTRDRLVVKASTDRGQHNIKHKSQASMPPAGFEPAIPETKIYALDRSATGTGYCIDRYANIKN
jgi:hypothetical protein